VYMFIMSFYMAIAGSKHAVQCPAGVPWPQQRKTAVTGSAPRSWEEGAQQFRDDVAVNPADTEEAVWAFMCEARLWGAERAREGFLQVCHIALVHALYFTVLPVVRASRASKPLLQAPQSLGSSQGECMGCDTCRAHHQTLHGCLTCQLLPASRRWARTRAR